jgi:K(+)-stimulated pyrophosphate-energized sodium pump
MKLLQDARPNAVRLAMRRKAFLALFATALVLAPTAAYASEGDSVVLQFGSQDKIWLWVAFAIGLLSAIIGFGLKASVLREAAGSAKMQEVGKAIQDGARAYLAQQIKTMIVFVAVLAVGLVALFWDKGTPTAIGIAVTFCLGVLGSYFSGYTGMLMAVASNMRVANAAIKSPKRSLEIAFRSGGVAGLITVGVALMGATLILLFGGEHATTLLIGFGFGGSLAALFMRVGGGIFTKAADVGADLVGKVEAGIPEDDPRNPAVIADNVGDNVGDCAGMVADVFESYEVTLVAAIILGAASASVFDQATWTRLIVFALVAAALGLAASVVGVSLVQGSDDTDVDPLKSITKGFWTSAGIAAVLIVGASFLLMGGSGKGFRTTQIFSAETEVQKEISQISDIRNSLAVAGHKKPSDITPTDIIAAPAGKALGLADQDAQFVAAALQASENARPALDSLTGYTIVTDPNDPRIAKMSMIHLPDPKTPPGARPPLFQSLGAGLVGTPTDPLEIQEMSILGDIPGTPPSGGRPGTPSRHIDIIRYVGPAKRSVNDQKVQDAMNQVKAYPGLSLTIAKHIPASLYLNGDGTKALLVADTEINGVHQLAGTYQSQPQTFYAETADKLNQLAGASLNQMPTTTPIGLAFSTHADVPWWGFCATIFFGILMALLLEKITDYYVSTHKKPVQEVAGVSNAGPAPMIIQGFAYGSESAVFMTIGLVIALMFPLFVFSPARYGTYILSFYGIALVGIGLLTTTAYVLAMDTFGPISDNAQGVFEMSGEADHHEKGAIALQRLDAAGNTTKALTKGFAIATAVIAAAALFHSFVDSAQLSTIGLRLDIPEIFLGLLLGGAAPYLFSSFTINAVGRAAFELIHEVRRQFASDPGIMNRTSKPDYAKCVAIVTAAAQKELLGPGILAIAFPVAVGFGFSIGKTPVNINGQLYNLTGAQALGGFLAGAIVSGQLLAVMLANSGGMWDNAKKLIEDGLYGGKGSEAHKASVVCDTVGDPFKDTAGPALNPLIKVMNLVALLLAGVIIRPFSDITLGIVTLIAIGALVFAVAIAKKGSMSTQMQKATGAAHDLDDKVVHHVPVGTGAASSVESIIPGPKKRLFVEEDEPVEEGHTPE